MYIYDAGKFRPCRLSFRRFGRESGRAGLPRAGVGAAPGGPFAQSILDITVRTDTKGCLEGYGA